MNEKTKPEEQSCEKETETQPATEKNESSYYYDDAFGYEIYIETADEDSTNSK